MAYTKLASLQSSHIGRHHVRKLLDSFDIVRPDGSRHLCLVHAPLHMTLHDLQRLGGYTSPLPPDMVKSAVRHVLQALDFLHTEVNLTHCDIKLSNLMLTIEDETMLTDFEAAERREPSARKNVDQVRSIYASRAFRRPQNHAWGYPVLCDFGEARMGGAYAYEEIQPEVYKAPEIIMQTEWSHSVDIWNVACLIWDMLEGCHLFDARDDKGFHNNRYHVAEMVAYLGEPPQEFQQRSSHAPLLFDETGHWKGHPPLRSLSIEHLKYNLDAADRAVFVSFLCLMLTWLPERRKGAKELLDHIWLSCKP